MTKRSNIMKTSALVVMSMFFLSASVPVLAKETPQDKFICELAVHNCLNKTELLEKRIEKLQKEIKNGNKYSPDELKILEHKLQDAIEQLEKIGGSE